MTKFWKSHRFFQCRSILHGKLTQSQENLILVCIGILDFLGSIGETVLQWIADAVSAPLNWIDPFNEEDRWGGLTHELRTFLRQVSVDFQAQQLSQLLTYL